MTRPRIAVPSQPLKSLEALSSHPHAYDTSPELDTLFQKALVEVLTWHLERSPFYRTLCESKGFAPEQLLQGLHWSQVPAVFATLFKRHEILSIPKEEVYLHLTSSGTTGQKSQIFFDEWTIRSAMRMVEFIWQQNGWVTDTEKTNYLLYTYEPQPGMKLGTSFTDNYLCDFAPVNRVTYALKNMGDGTHEFDVFGCIRALQEYAEEGLPVRIFGFPSFMSFTLDRMKDMGLEALKLHPHSMTFFGGGWKGHAEKQIQKSELYRHIHERLGIPDARIRDGYGSVEHCIPYIECSHHEFHAPLWSRMCARDVQTLDVLPEGEVGFLHFVSPYITSVPGNSVIMGDLASIHSGSSCGCGLKTPLFRLHGRAGTSQSKSCAIAASELLDKRKKA